MTSAPVPSASTVNPKSQASNTPSVRTIDSIRNLNTLTYLVINARALRRVRELNATLLTAPVRMVA
jgi:hypothetical protein